LFFLLFVACAKPEPAPADLDGLVHLFFAKYDTATDEELRAAAVNLLPLLQEPSRGLVDDLTAEEQATVRVDPPRDPADATGMFVAGPIACTLADLEVVNYALDQEGLYEAVTGDEEYIAYDRVYESDLAAYEARTDPFLTWRTTYTVQPVMSEYTAEIDGGMRFVPALDGVGPVVMSRSTLPSPATFAGETDDFFDQDYQIDVMLGDGDTSVHVYVAWRNLSSLGLEDESAGVQDLLLNGFEDFDRDTELVCAAGEF